MYIYNVFDTKTKRWLYKNIFLSPNGDLVYKTFFNRIKLLSNTRYKLKINTHIVDKDGKFLFTNDIVKCAGLVGIIQYAAEQSAFVFLDYSQNKYYPISLSLFSKEAERLGDIFNNPDLIPKLQYSTGEIDGK